MCLWEVGGGWGGGSWLDGSVRLAVGSLDGLICLICLMVSSVGLLDIAAGWLGACLENGGLRS